MAIRILKQDLYPLRWDLLLAILYVSSTYLLLGPHNTYSRQIIPIAPFAVLFVVQLYFVFRMCEREVMSDGITFFANLPRDRALTLQLRMLVLLGITLLCEGLIAAGLWIYERSGSAPLPLFVPGILYVMPLFVMASLFWMTHERFGFPGPVIVGVLGTFSVIMFVYSQHDSRMDYSFEFFDFALCVLYLGATVGITIKTYKHWTQMQIGIVQ